MTADQFGVGAVGMSVKAFPEARVGHKVGRGGFEGVFGNVNLELGVGVGGHGCFRFAMQRAKR